MVKFMGRVYFLLSFFKTISSFFLLEMQIATYKLIILWTLLVAGVKKSRGFNVSKTLIKNRAKVSVIALLH